MRYLLDTNVCILGIAGREPDASFLWHAIEGDKVGLSVVTMAEFLSKASKAESKALEKIAAVFPVFGIDARVARQAAIYRHRHTREAKRVSLLDCFIAAQAKEYDAILVTNNLKDFPMKDIRVLAPGSALKNKR